tara:strand:- start:143 stop:679 length:537 start_codon:yes stop_codon:yes gene_type:complete
MINVIDTNIKDVKLIEPQIHRDTRGYFFESYVQEEFYKKIGPINFIQDNESKSSYGVLRGLHFQKKPYEQAKLVRVIKGEILDVAVDIRTNSPTFKQHFSIILNDSNNLQLFVPKGFAHGFVVLSQEAIISYKVDQIYHPKSDSGYKYDDPQFDIDWTIEKEDIILSKKDNKLPLINE